MIDGIKTIDLPVFEDDRGFLFECLHNYDLVGAVPATFGVGVSNTQDDNLTVTNKSTPAIPGRFGQVYIVGSPVRGTVRAFHKHKLLWDYFCIVSGAAKFALVDDRAHKIIKTVMEHDLADPSQFAEEPSPGDTQIIVASAAQPKLLIVPPGIFHGWVSLSDGVILVSVASELYDRANPDEIRVPPFYFDISFGGNPWEVRGR